MSRPDLLAPGVTDPAGPRPRGAPQRSTPARRQVRVDDGRAAEEGGEARAAARPARLNWGCGPHPEPGWLNSDLRDGEGIDHSCDIRDGLPLPDASLDYVASMHALCMIGYDELVPVLAELRRVLKPAGTLRLGLPDLDRGIAAYLRGDESHFYVPDRDRHSLGGKFITHMLWYGWSRMLFTGDFAEELLLEAGFRQVHHCAYQVTASAWDGIVDLDNREHESLFVEATK